MKIFRVEDTTIRRIERSNQRKRDRKAIKTLKRWLLFRSNFQVAIAELRNRKLLYEVNDEKS